MMNEGSGYTEDTEPESLDPFFILHSSFFTSAKREKTVISSRDAGLMQNDE